MHLVTQVMLGICIFLSLIIITCVAMQQTKSEGLSGTIGGARGGSFKGSRQDEMLSRLTRYTGIAWLGCYIILAYMWSHF